MNAGKPDMDGLDNFDIVTLAGLFWAGKWLILATMAATFSMAVLFLNLARYTYTIEYQVTPTEAGQGSLMGMLGGIGAIAGVSLGGEEPASPFGLYVESLRGRTVATVVARDEQLMRQMFPEQWDDHRGQWQKPVGAVPGLAETAKRILGLPIQPWRAPGPAQAQRYLERKINVVEIPKKSLSIIRIDHENPKFASALLAKLHAAGDEQIRIRTLIRTTAYIDFLERKLPTIQISEQRQALAKLLSDQEKQRLMASAGVPYAAELFSPITVSPGPTFPKPVLTLVLSLAVGLFAGCLLVFIRHLLQRRRAG